MKRPQSLLHHVRRQVSHFRPRPGGATAQARRQRLRNLLGATRSRRRVPEVAPARVALFVVTASLLSALLCIHLWPNRVTLRAGDIADHEIVAQRTVRYEDTDATRQLRDDAAAHTEKQYNLIPDATTTALDSVRAVFDTVDRTARLSASVAQPAPAVAPGAALTRPALPPVTVKPDTLARQVTADIRRQASVFVPLPDVEILLRQDTAARENARTVAMKLVERTMTRSISDDGDELAQNKRDLGHDPLLLSLPAALRPPVAAIAGAVLTPTRRYDARETERRRGAAQGAILPQMRRVPAGAAIVRVGERVTQQHLDAFAALGLQTARLDALTVAVIATMVWLLTALVCAYLRQFHADLYTHTGHLTLLSILSVVSVLGLKVGSTLLGLPFSGVHVGYLGMMCVASAGMVIALLLSPRVATLIVALLSVASGLILNNELRFTVVTLGSSLVGIIAVSSLRNRGDLLRATLLLCGANAVIISLVGQLQGDMPTELLTGALWGVISGLFALVLFWLGVAVFEKWFGITTHLRLLELSDPATPILQEFRLKVPGTYAHSLMVGNLAHAAAEAIGADGLLVRVAAYYHDLGKMNRPEFYIENQSNAENVHDRINPSLSALVLAAHVKEGLEMAEAVGLPPRVREVMEQHHGTTLMKYFYHRATGGVADPALEAQFRYPGPRPQTKEAAILMLADSVEAASRTVENPTPARLADFVARIVEEKRADGQLDECDLTLRDLRAIQEIFVRTLSGTLHARIKYPEAARKDAAPANDDLSPLTLPRLGGEGATAPASLVMVHGDEGASVSSLTMSAGDGAAVYSGNNYGDNLSGTAGTAAALVGEGTGGGAHPPRGRR